MDSAPRPQARDADTGEPIEERPCKTCGEDTWFAVDDSEDVCNECRAPRPQEAPNELAALSDWIEWLSDHSAGGYAPVTIPAASVAPLVRTLEAYSDVPLDAGAHEGERRSGRSIAVWVPTDAGSRYCDFSVRTWEDEELIAEGYLRPATLILHERRKGERRIDNPSVGPAYRADPKEYANPAERSGTDRLQPSGVDSHAHSTGGDDGRDRAGQGGACEDRGGSCVRVQAMRSGRNRDADVHDQGDGRGQDTGGARRDGDGDGGVPDRVVPSGASGGRDVLSDDLDTIARVLRGSGPHDLGAISVSLENISHMLRLRALPTPDTPARPASPFPLPARAVQDWDGMRATWCVMTHDGAVVATYFGPRGEGFARWLASAMNAYGTPDTERDDG